MSTRSSIAETGAPPLQLIRRGTGEGKEPRSALVAFEHRPAVVLEVSAVEQETLHRITRAVRPVPCEHGVRPQCAGVYRRGQPPGPGDAVGRAARDRQLQVMDVMPVVARLRPNTTTLLLHRRGRRGRRGKDLWALQDRKPWFPPFPMLLPFSAFSAIPPPAGKLCGLPAAAGEIPRCSTNLIGGFPRAGESGQKHRRDAATSCAGGIAELNLRGGYRVICLCTLLRSTQHFVCDARDLRADPQQRLERRHGRAAAVEAERELVQVGLKMLRRDAVSNAGTAYAPQ